ncbi:MAG TPA: hypothetical protein V6C69_09195 [Trichormus sp.]
MLASQSFNLIFRLATVLVCSLSLAGNAMPARADERLSGLSASAREVAKDIGVLELLSKWLDARDQEATASGKRITLETLYLRDQLLGTVLNKSLQIRSCISKLDADLASTDELRRAVDERTQKNTTKSEVANFINSGICEVISTGVGLSAPSLGLPAAVVGAYGGTMEIALSLLSLKLEHSERASSPRHPNMLAELYGFAADGKVYPAAVWEYLHDNAPNSKMSRVESLKLKWDELGYTTPDKHEKIKNRLPILTGTVDQKRKLSLDLLEDRTSMLQDLRATISAMDQDMSEIVSWALTQLDG